MSTTAPTATIEFGETNFVSAEIWKWEDGEGILVATAAITQHDPIRCQVRMLDGNRWLPGVFRDPKDALAAVGRELGI